MAGGPPAAARLKDPVAHSHALAGFLLGSVVGVAASAVAEVAIGAVAVVAAGALEVATGGLATPLIIGAVVTAGELYANYKVGGALIDRAQAEGEKLGAEHMAAPSGEVTQGSMRVKVNRRPAARVLDEESCHTGKIAQGAKTVWIDGRPAARVGDKTTCGAVIVKGSGDVMIGGPTDTRAGIQPEISKGVRLAVTIATLLPALSKLARGIGPAIAEVKASGFVGALKAGAKSLKQVLEEKGGAPKAPETPPETTPNSSPETPEETPAGAETPASEPPASEPPASEPPASEPLASEPSASEPQQALPAPEQQLALPAPEEQLALPEPKPSEYPFAGEPTQPAGGARPDYDFSPERPAGGVDMTNLSPEDQAASDAMAKGGWDPKMQEQVLNSGDGFDVRDGQAGEPMYKFSSAGRDESTAPDSAYYTDQAGFDDLKAQHYDDATGTWDSAGVKNSVALPCYNTADAVWQGNLTQDQPLVTSTTNPVTETVTQKNPDGSASSIFQRSMTGGGGQVTPAKGGVGGLKPYTVPPAGHP